MLMSFQFSKLHFILISLFAIYIICLIYADLYGWYDNHGDVVNMSSRKTDLAVKKSIAILSIAKSISHKEKYITAMASMECYAMRNNYTYLQLYGNDFKAVCGQKDIYFQRHCIVAHILKTYNFTWVFQVEGDIGVVNEKKRLEEYIIEHVDIIFYERFFSFEVAAGSYFAKKSEFSVVFLRGWADYSYRLPKSFRTSDNEAIHMWFVELLAPNAPLTPICWTLWRAAIDFETLDHFTVCCREVMKNVTSSRIFIYKRGKAWVRDGWLTNSYWNPERDFMFHGRKERDRKIFAATPEKILNGPKYFAWFDTLNTSLDLSKCKEGEQVWNHETGLIINREAIDLHLEKWEQSLEQKYYEELEFLEDFSSKCLFNN